MASVHSDSKASDATLESGEDLTQYRFVNGNLTTGVLQYPRVEGHRAIGITQEDFDVSVNAFGKIRVLGCSKLELGGTVNAYDALMPTTTGTGIIATGANAQSAIALQSGVTGDIIEVVVCHGGECTVS